MSAVVEGACSKCGSFEVVSVTYWQCGGKGGEDGDDLMEIDPLWYGPDDFRTCDICRGKGGFDVCARCASEEEAA